MCKKRYFMPKIERCRLKTSSDDLLFISAVLFGFIV